MTFHSPITSARARFGASFVALSLSAAGCASEAQETTDDNVDELQASASTAHFQSETLNKATAALVAARDARPECGLVVGVYKRRSAVSQVSDIKLGDFLGGKYRTPSWKEAIHLVQGRPLDTFIKKCYPDFVDLQSYLPTVPAGKELNAFILVTIAQDTLNRHVYEKVSVAESTDSTAEHPQVLAVEDDVKNSTAMLRVEY